MPDPTAAAPPAGEPVTERRITGRVRRSGPGLLVDHRSRVDEEPGARSRPDVPSRRPQEPGAPADPGWRRLTRPELSAPTPEPARARWSPSRITGWRDEPGVAPFVAPGDRPGRLRWRHRMSRRGFVALSPARVKLRHRILPRTVIGIAFSLACLGIGAAFAGAAFYAYYDARLAENEQTVSRFVDGFETQFDDATAAIDAQRVAAVEDVRNELSPLGDVVTDANGVIGLPDRAGASVWRVETRGQDGEARVGAAFAVAKMESGTALLTSFELVSSSSTAPAPPIEVVKNGQRYPAQLWTWDVDRDLAVVRVDVDVPVLEIATHADLDRLTGVRLFAMSGVGGRGASAAPGVIVDLSDQGVQHTAPIGTFYQGGPLLSADGRVIGLATTHFRPYGVDAGAVGLAPGIDQLCASILACGTGAPTVGDQTPIPEATPEPGTGVEADVEG
ncbi:MAG: serine protease [Acidimicrobiales bacterium]